MVRGIGFRDAVQLLGGRASSTVAALDKLTGGLLLTTSASGISFAASLFDPKAELARLAESMVSGLQARISGLGRFERTERLTAAHAVIVLAAYFDAVPKVVLPLDPKRMRLTAGDQVLLATGSRIDSQRLRNVADAMLSSDVPMPAPQLPYEEALRTLDRYYRTLSTSVFEFTKGLDFWDELDQTRQARFADALNSDVPRLALDRYEEYFRRLAGEFPEMAFWANLVDHQATRFELRKLTIGLAGVERLLAELSPRQLVDDPLRLVYRTALRRPVISSRDVPAGLRIPVIGQAYVTPRFRTASASGLHQVADERWWQQQQIRDDLQSFLVGHLTSAQATQAPLLVLGQPGSGKSLLTEVLAARLARSDYLVVRVALRDVRAEADLQSQIEHAVRAATGTPVMWPELASSAAGSLPVVLLDGFDELLQATGVSQSDYLERVAGFQYREATLGRPVVVIVTSRTAVADRARPADGMVTVRIEPFVEAQIAQWLSMWNDANASFFTVNGLRPLTPESVLPHLELACQPLLLLMLALYDADGNALQNHDTALGHAELYERLLVRFAEREVGKSGNTLSHAVFERAIDQELLGLAIVSFAMFNRNRQWVTEAELDADLNALLDISPAHESGLRATLTAAQLVLGRFFFIHETRAIQDDTRLRTFEFLHATFGEYLISRLVCEELRDLASTVRTRGRPTTPDDSFFHALLSFAPLTARGTIVSFLAEQLRGITDGERTKIRGLLLRLIHQAAQPRHVGGYDDYRPSRATVPERHATYSANLTVLAVLATGQIAVTDLFPDSADPIHQWRRLTLLWRSQLPDEGWKELFRSFTVHRDWHGDERAVHVTYGSPPNHEWQPDPYWIYGHYGPGHPHRPQKAGQYLGWNYATYGYVRKQSRFQCIADDDILMHTLDALYPVLGASIFTFHIEAGWEVPVSAARALIELCLATAEPDEREQLTHAFEIGLYVALHGFGPNETEQRHRYRQQVLRQLMTHRDHVSRDFLRNASIAIVEVARKEPDQRLLRLAQECRLVVVTETDP